MTSVADVARVLLPVGHCVVTVRAITPADADALTRMHRGLSPDTVHQRFFGQLPELSPAQVSYFTHVDGDLRFALVAEDPEGELVAVARYDRLPRQRELAEVAIVVTDRYQHHGLGPRLLLLLSAHARSAGVVALVADVLSENRRARRILTGAGLVFETAYERDVVHLQLSLGRSRPNPD